MPTQRDADMPNQRVAEQPSLPHTQETTGQLRRLQCGPLTGLADDAPQAEQGSLSNPITLRRIPAAAASHITEKTPGCLHIY